LVLFLPPFFFFFWDAVFSFCSDFKDFKGNLSASFFSAWLGMFFLGNFLFFPKALFKGFPSSFSFSIVPWRAFFWTPALLVMRCSSSPSQTRIDAGLPDCSGFSQTTMIEFFFSVYDPFPISVHLRLQSLHKSPASSQTNIPFF